MDIKTTLENVIKTLDLPEPNIKKLKKCVDNATQPIKPRKKKYQLFATFLEEEGYETKSNEEQIKLLESYIAQRKDDAGTEKEIAYVKRQLKPLLPKGKRGRKKAAPLSPEETKEETIIIRGSTEPRKVSFTPKEKKVKPVKKITAIKKGIESVPTDKNIQVKKFLKKRLDTEELMKIYNKKSPPITQEQIPTPTPEPKPISKVSFTPKDKKKKPIKIITKLKKEEKPIQPLPAPLPGARVGYSNMSPLDKEIFLYRLGLPDLRARLLSRTPLGVLVRVKDKDRTKAVEQMKDKRDIILLILQQEASKYGVVEPVLTNMLKNPPYSQLKTADQAFKKYLLDLKKKPDEPTEPRPRGRPKKDKPIVVYDPNDPNELKNIRGRPKKIVATELPVPKTPPEPKPTSKVSFVPKDKKKKPIKIITKLKKEEPETEPIFEPLAKPVAIPPEPEPAEEPAEEPKPDDESVIFDYSFEPENYIIDPLPLLSMEEELEAFIKTLPTLKQRTAQRLDAINEERKKMTINKIAIEQKYEPLLEGLTGKDASRIRKERDGQIMEIQKDLKKKVNLIDDKYDELEKEIDRKENEKEKEVKQKDYLKLVIDMLVDTLKKKIKQDKTITIDDQDNFKINIDGDVMTYTAKEMIETFLDKYNELKYTSYSTRSVKKYFDEAEQQKLVDFYRGSSRGSGKTASLSRGAGETASVIMGRGYVEDKSLLYNIPRRFL